MAENTGAVVVIPLERYNDLIQLETRVDVAVERIFHDKYIKTEDLLWIINTDIACKLAQEIRIEEHNQMEEWKKNHESEVEDAIIEDN